MKVTRYKKVHRYLSFFRNNFGFRQPYQILIDGTFCLAALKNKLNIHEQIPKYLDGSVKLLTTQCVILETEKLGSAVYGAMLIVKQFAVHKCGHDKEPITADKCLTSMLGPNNEKRYILATQDRGLQIIAREIPGTPILYLHDKAPTLEQPSRASTSACMNKDQKYGVTKYEETILSWLKKKEFGVVEEEKSKKKKKKCGPNPLSCKKKKKKNPPEMQNNPEGIKRRRHRKRIKISKHVKEQVALKS